MFHANRWIFVGDMDKCKHSKDQVSICKKLGLEIKGAILCNDKEHENTEACHQVPAFPSFCNIDTKVCVSGLRESMDDFHELQKISDEKKK